VAKNHQKSMTNILIIEDEHYAAKRLQTLLAECMSDAHILGVCDSIEDSVEFLKNKPKPDLIFMDIQLADGLSFDIFKQVEVTTPVIFSTAFDEYTLQAFKVNSIDYLLKPVDKKELENALEKFKTLYQDKTQSPDWKELLHAFQQPKKVYKTRFLVKNGQEFIRLNMEDVAYYYSEDGLTFAVNKQGKRHIIDPTLDQLLEQINPEFFYRINRKQIVQIDSIEKIHTYFNNRLKLDLRPVYSSDVIVSRERVKEFKQWIGG
jgi:two-component system response regulator LytT